MILSESLPDFYLTFFLAYPGILSEILSDILPGISSGYHILHSIIHISTECIQYIILSDTLPGTLFGVLSCCIWHRVRVRWGPESRQAHHRRKLVRLSLCVRIWRYCLFKSRHTLAGEELAQQNSVILVYQIQAPLF